MRPMIKPAIASAPPPIAPPERLMRPRERSPRKIATIPRITPGTPYKEAHGSAKIPTTRAATAILSAGRAAGGPKRPEGGGGGTAVTAAGGGPTLDSAKRGPATPA